MEPAAFKALYSAEKPKLEEENLIFFCQMGRRGLQATQLAQGLGYTGYWEGVGASWTGTGDGLLDQSFLTHFVSTGLETTQEPIENGPRKKIR